MSFFQIFDLTNEFNILRLICGLFLLPHFYAKASDLELTYKIYDDFRLYPVKAWVFSCMAIEIVCAIGMVFAIYTRYVASLEAVFLFVAAWRCGATARGNGCGKSAVSNTACSGGFAALSSRCTAERKLRQVSLARPTAAAMRSR
jgi:uncharacterized membrane protein YphA (DoxX/SURF4 family)